MSVLMLQAVGCVMNERVFVSVCDEMCVRHCHSSCSCDVLAAVEALCVFCSAFPDDVTEEENAAAEESIYANLEDIEW